MYQLSKKALKDMKKSELIDRNLTLQDMNMKLQEQLDMALDELVKAKMEATLSREIKKQD
jgi:hypothetical protein